MQQFVIKCISSTANIFFMLIIKFQLICTSLIYEQMLCKTKTLPKLQLELPNNRDTLYAYQFNSWYSFLHRLSEIKILKICNSLIYVHCHIICETKKKPFILINVGEVIRTEGHPFSSSPPNRHLHHFNARNLPRKTQLEI